MNSLLDTIDPAVHDAAREAVRLAKARANGNAAPIDLAPQGSAFAWLGVSEVFAELPKTKWIVEGLQLCPGRPTTIVAFGASGKTLAMQSAGLSIASGLPVWGRFATPTPLRFKHIDHEQGRHATLKRYQRLAIGLGIGPEHLGDRLGVSLFPNVYLNQPSAEDVYARECEGTDLVLIDALKGATPGEDENDSKIRACLDVLTRVSEKTGCAFAIIHHAGKPKTDGSSDPRFIGRGSSGIYDASGCQFVIVGEKGEAKQVTQAKMPAEGEGRGVDDFVISIDDVPIGANPTAGLRVAASDLPEKKTASRYDQIRENVLACVRANPGCSGARIEADVRGNRQAVRTVVGELVAEGCIAKLGPDKAPQYRIGRVS